MENEEIELIPSGLVSCLLDDIEVRILKISPKKLTIRISQKIEKISCVKIAFYIFDKGKYEEVIINDFNVIKEKEERFWWIYTLEIENKEYLNKVRNIIVNYSQYVRLKTFGFENEFSKNMVKYPYELDYEFYEFYSEQKKDWMAGLNYLNWNKDIIKNVELAINLDNYILYKKFLDNNINEFKNYYLEKNFISSHKLFQNDIKRIYIGNQFCHNLFPEINLLIKMIHKAKNENLNVTLCFTYMRDNYIDKTKDIIDKIYDWCKENEFKIEIVINDFGMLKMVEDKITYFKLNLGVLLNKRKKDPRYIYKKGFNENIHLIKKNTLNSNAFEKFMKQYKINRYEYESCGYRIEIPKGRHSLHIPFYQTNTSQYCPMYSMCTTMDRGNNKLVTKCPHYCEDYIFTYPKHLKMVGAYNSLFAFDDTLLRDSLELDYYINNGINRVVLNFI